MGIVADVGLTAAIKAAMLADPLLDGSRIDVDTVERVVKLSGVVPNLAERDLAEAIALRIGAESVTNMLTVTHDERFHSASIPENAPRVTTPEGAPLVSEPPLEERVQDALTRDERVNEHLLRTRVENGVVHLEGRQDTEPAREAAVEVAAHVRGVVAVEEDIEVLPSV